VLFGTRAAIDRRANLLPSPTAWVIAFSTTGGRMVLEFYSPQPFVLVLNYSRPYFCLNAS
jgi:hypothetical protein